MHATVSISGQCEVRALFTVPAHVICSVVEDYKALPVEVYVGMIVVRLTSSSGQLMLCAFGGPEVFRCFDLIDSDMEKIMVRPLSVGESFTVGLHEDLETVSD